MTGLSKAAAKDFTLSHSGNLSSSLQAQLTNFNNLSRGEQRQLLRMVMGEICAAIEATPSALTLDSAFDNHISKDQSQLRLIYAYLALFFL